MCVARRLTAGGPRSVRGGRSERYEERRLARGTVAAKAPSWSDATAAAVLQVLEDASEMATGSKKLAKKKVARMLASAEGVRLLSSCVSGELVLADRELVGAIVQKAHQGMLKCYAEGDEKKAEKRAHSFLKPLYERRAARGVVEHLPVPHAAQGPASFHDWLGPGVQGEKLRDVEKSKRMLEGVSCWPLGWLDETGVVCYERALGRVHRERPEANGIPDETFTKRLVKTVHLPTAVANAADHYVVIEPGEEIRFMRTSEMARAFMIPESSALMPVLLGQRKAAVKGAKLLTAVQAASCLGRSVHTGVARQIVALLKARGVLPERPGELELSSRDPVEDRMNGLAPGIPLGENGGVKLMLAKHGLVRLKLVPLRRGDGRAHELETVLGVQGGGALGKVKHESLRGVAMVASGGLGEEADEPEDAMERGVRPGVALYRRVDPARG